MSTGAVVTPVILETPGARLPGDLTLPAGATAIVVFVHGSGSSRLSPRNRRVAGRLSDAAFAALLFDLLTSDEEAVDIRTARLRFDIGLLARRLIAVTDWLASDERTASLQVGYFGASTGAAAALVAATERPDRIRAIVSRGGRPDLAAESLDRVRAPTLLIVGSHDEPVIEMNRRALDQLRAPAELKIVPGATHLFEEPGKLDEVAGLAIDWFRRYLAGG